MSTTEVTSVVDPGAEAAEQLAESRQGWELVGYAEVALPYFRITTRLRVIARKCLGPIDEYVLHSVGVGVIAPEDIGALLGLDEPVLEATVVGLMQREALRLNGDQLSLTPLGDELIKECAQIVSEVSTVEIDWDGLLRHPVAALSSWYEPRELREIGLREVPPTPATRPDVDELRRERDPIEELIRRAGDRRLGTVEVLDVGGIDRRYRIFRPAVALAFQQQTSRDIQIAIVIDGRTSAAHEEAFAKAGLARRFGVSSRGLASTPTIRSALGDAYDRAGVVAPYQHRRLLDAAISSSHERLLVLGYRLRRAVLDKDMIELLESKLVEGVSVHIGYGVRGRDGAEVDRDVLDTLHRLSDTHEKLVVGRLRRAHPCLLVSDSAPAVVTGFDWLGYRGDPTGLLADQRGRIVSAPEVVESLYTTFSTQVSEGKMARTRSRPAKQRRTRNGAR
jgi:hypothetical protein